MERKGREKEGGNGQERSGEKEKMDGLSVKGSEGRGGEMRRGTREGIKEKRWTRWRKERPREARVWLKELLRLHIYIMTRREDG